LDQVMRIPAQTHRPEHLSVIAENPFNIEEVHEQANTRKSDQEIYGGLMRASPSQTSSGAD
jgi:hypothetical protein